MSIYTYTHALRVQGFSIMLFPKNVEDCPEHSRHSVNAVE